LCDFLFIEIPYLDGVGQPRKKVKDERDRERKEKFPLFLSDFPTLRPYHTSTPRLWVIGERGKRERGEKKGGV
jgi:hypothetical protein